jgi:hypothetical protein
MKWMCQTVHKEEDYTLRYLMTEKLDAEEPEYIVRKPMGRRVIRTTGMPRGVSPPSYPLGDV